MSILTWRQQIPQNQHFSRYSQPDPVATLNPNPATPGHISAHVRQGGIYNFCFFIFLNSAFFIQQHSWQIQIQITKSSKRDNQNDLFRSIFIAVSNPDQSHRISHDNNHLLLTMTTIKARRAKLMIENYYSNLLLQQHQRSPEQLYLYSCNKN